MKCNHKKGIPVNGTIVRHMDTNKYNKFSVKEFNQYNLIGDEFFHKFLEDFNLEEELIYANCFDVEDKYNFNAIMASIAIDVVEKQVDIKKLKSTFDNIFGTSGSITAFACALCVNIYNYLINEYENYEADYYDIRETLSELIEEHRESANFFLREMKEALLEKYDY